MFPWSDGLLAAAAVIVASGVVIGSAVKVYKFAKRIDHALGTDRDGRSLADRMSRVEHQLWPNGGSSLADKVARIERGQTETQAEVRVVRDLLTTLVERD